METKNKDSDINPTMAKVIPIGIILFVGILAMFALVINGSQNNTYNDTGEPKKSSIDLNIEVQTGIDGVHITNNENSTLNDCVIGINGTFVALIHNPPFYTHSPLTLNVGKNIVSFNKITSDDGTRFNPLEKTVNSTEIMCDYHSSNVRIFDGSSSQN